MVSAREIMAYTRGSSAGSSPRACRVPRKSLTSANARLSAVSIPSASRSTFSSLRSLRSSLSRSEEHTSELQSLTNLVCRLLLEKKKKIQKNPQNCNQTAKDTKLQSED